MKKLGDNIHFIGFCVSTALLVGVLFVGCQGHNYNPDPSFYSRAMNKQVVNNESQSAKHSFNVNAPHLELINSWHTEAQYISWTTPPHTGCIFPMSPPRGNLLPGTSTHLEDTDGCMGNINEKTFVQVEPVFLPYSCTVGIRKGGDGHWRFGLVPKLRGLGSDCKLVTKWNRAKLFYNVKTP